MFSRDLWQQARKVFWPLSSAISLGGAIGGLIVAQAWMISTIIAGVFLGGENLAENQNRLLILAAIVLVRGVITYLRELSAGKVSIQVRYDLKRELFAHLLSISPIRITRERTGEIINTLGQGIDRLDAYFRTYLPQLGLALLVPLIILVVVFPLDWLTGLIFFLTAPLIPVFMVLIGKEAENQTERQWKLLGRLSSHFLDVLQGLRTLKAFGLSKRQGRVVESISEQYARITLKVLKVAFLSALALELLATISTAIVAVQIGLRLLYGQITFVESLFILILAPEFYFPLRQLGAAFHSGMEGIAAGERIFSLLRSDPQIPVIRAGLPLSGLTSGKIKFDNVSFAYQEGSRISLRSASFEIPLGKHTALVGASGTGKSTIFALLMGFIEPQQGDIWINGLRLGELSLADWRAQIGWVPQSPYLFNDTVLANIKAARRDASEAEVLKAARQAQVEGFIDGLPEGYHTVVGERGVRFSGGQAQRLAIARSFLQNPAILLLDEPANSLDPENLLAIQSALDTFKTGRTVITISHQLSRIKTADQIILLDQGAVIESGDHETLVAAFGRYHALTELQGKPI